MRNPDETNIQIRISKADKEKLKLIANENGKTISGYLRSLYMEAIAEYNGDNMQNPNTAITMKRKEYTPGKKEWCNYIYQTTVENKNKVAELAIKLNTTPNLFIKKLMTDWLEAKNHGSELGNIVIHKRPRGTKENEDKIYIQLTTQEKRELKAVLSKIDRTTPALIDALLDNYIANELQR